MPPLVIEMLLVQAQGFDDHQWVEPLWRLNDAHGSLAVSDSFGFSSFSSAS